MRIADKDTEDDVKYHLMAENPPELRARGCGDYFTLADKTKVCKIRRDSAIFVTCAKRIEHGECPKGITNNEG